MTDELFTLQIQYANAIYQAERYTREAQFAKAQLDQLAKEEAERFCMPAPGPQLVATPPPAPVLIATDPLRGIRAEVARSLGVSATHVSEVAAGRRTSAKVTAALQQAIGRFTSGSQERVG